MTYNKNKYYRVIKSTNNYGISKFEVQSCETLLELIFGLWTGYTKINRTIDDAIQQIETLNKHRIIDTKKVFFKKAWNNYNNIP